MVESDIVSDKDRMRQLVSSDPGNDICVDYIALLLREGIIDEARSVVFKARALNQDSPRIKLAFVQVLYRSGLYDIAARELSSLAAEYPEKLFLQQLVARLGATVSAGKPQTTVAEDSFDVDLIDT